MIKKVVLLLIGFVIVVTGVVIAIDYFTKKPIHFTLTDSGYTVEILKDDKNITSINSSSFVRLSEGSYQYVVKGDNYLDLATDFEVTKSTDEITIIPEYSDDYKQELLNKEEPMIRAALIEKYPTIFSQFHIYEISLYSKDKWAAGILAQTVDRRSSPDYYRFVLEKKDSKWNVVVEPQIAIKASNYPSVPKEVMNNLYSKSTEYKSY